MVARDEGAAEARTTRGGQPWYLVLAILTALTLRAVFRLAYRRAKGLLGPVAGLLRLQAAGVIAIPLFPDLIPLSGLYLPCSVRKRSE